MEKSFILLNGLVIPILKIRGNQNNISLMFLNILLIGIKKRKNF
jgi:hypothetical protein